MEYMTGKLSLIKTGLNDVEKRVFPRFPFCYLTFKGEGHKKAFEVKDISYTGMQLSLRDGGHTFRNDETINGELHWKGKEMGLSATIIWVSEGRLGLKFENDASLNENIRNFLSIENIIAGMRPVHSANVGLELPPNLKCWLQADGPVEVFVWAHNGGEISRFQVITLDSFIEYQDGKGLESGRVLTKRNLDTPLVSEDEFLFEFDDILDEEKLKFAQAIIENTPKEYLPPVCSDFLKLKLGISND
jgi:hypothetical protein